MRQSTAPRGMLTFTMIWFGQLISTVGSGLTSFALGVWVYQREQSVTLFALTLLAATLPNVLLSPIAGALADRWNRRTVMILSDAGAGLATLSIALLLFSGQLQTWHVYVAVAANAAFSSLQWPAYSAATTMLVPKEHLGRAGGMVQIGEAISQLISPVLAGALFVTIGLPAIILIDFATFAFAIFTLLIVRIPQPEATAEGQAGKGSLLSEAAYGWKYITARRGLLGLLLYFAAVNFLDGMIGPVITPMVLDLAGPAVWGLIGTIIGVGMLAGTIVMSIWGGPKRRIYGVIVTGAIASAFIALLGVRASIPLITFAGFGAMFLVPIMNGSSQALWQSKVAADVQGRVFAVRRMIAWSTTPLAILLAGPLVDGVFDPLMAVDGPLATTVGRIIGVGPGRGAGLLFVVIGMMGVLVSAIALSNPRVRRVELELPDAVAPEKGVPETGKETPAAVEPTAA